MQQKLPGLKLFKPAHTEANHRIFSPAAKQFTMAFGVMVPFDLQAPGQPVATERDTPLWERIQSVLGQDQIVDEGWPKPRGEFLATGHCYYPASASEQPIAATISIGSLIKKLAVFGDRHVIGSGGISKPAPFERIPLTWEYAFGGPDYAANPVGKGADSSLTPRPLPNIENPNQLIFSPSDRPEPAGFGPLSSALPQRTRFLGQHSHSWQKERWPHLPEDSDARFFQAALEDQHAATFWKAGDAVRIQNMHPDAPVLEGQLPRLRPRFFVHQDQTGNDAKFLELHVHADTVWLMPEIQLGLVIYRASLPVQDITGYDINAFYAEFEPEETAPLPTEYYLNNCLRLMSPELFKDLPDPLSAETQAELSQLTGQDVIETVRRQRSYFEAMLASSGLREDELLRQLEANPQTRQVAQNLLQNNRSVSAFFNEIEGLLEILNQTDNSADTPSVTPAPELNLARTPYPQPAAFAAQSPSTPKPATRPDPSAGARARQMVINASRNGQSCADMDLSHANLAGLDLAGMDFSRAVLAGANFAGAQLQGACFDQVFASQVRFDAADMAGCSLRQASLQQASFVGTQLRGADLQQSNCTEANFSGAELQGANLQKTVLSLAWLQNCRADRLMANGAQFDHANLDNVSFKGASLGEANLTGASAQRANLQDILAPKVNLSQADLSGANLQNAMLANSQAGPGTSLAQAFLDGAQLENASWAGACLSSISLNRVQAQLADFSDTDLQGALLTRADLRQCSFDRANLARADCNRSNLMQASFLAANLSSSNFNQSNLYNATFVETVLDGAQFIDANLDRTALSR